MNTKINRLSWPDYGKAICMLIIMLFHTELIYLGDTSLFTELVFYHTSVVFFFYISGYLTNVENFSFKKSIESLLKRLLIPYFIFSTIIYIPKQLIHGWDFDILKMIEDIFGGIASWFVAALIVSKLIQSIVLKFTKNFYVIGIIFLLLSICGFILTHYLPPPIYWRVNFAFISMIYLFIGMLYKKYEHIISKNKISVAICSTILYFALSFLILDSDIWFYIYGLNVGKVAVLPVLVYLFISVIGILMTTSLVKLIPTGIKWLSYIGVNSLTYYYLNTGLLLVLTTIMNKIGITEIYPWFTLPLYLIVVILLTFASEIILRFAPWMVGYSKKN